MPKLPEKVKAAWEKRKGPAVFATANSEAVPNVIYVTCIARYDDSTIVVADNYFDKTRHNLLGGSNGALLFITEDNKTYQIKGTMGYHTSGPIYDSMKAWNPDQHPGHAAAALSVEEVYSGSDKLL